MPKARRESSRIDSSYIDADSYELFTSWRLVDADDFDCHGIQDWTMKRKVSVVIFGNASLANLAWYCLNHDSPWQVAAFTVDQAFLKTSTHEGLPVVPFEQLEEYYPPDHFKLLIPLGFQRINGLRRDRYLYAKIKGYEFISYVSSRASIWPDFHIGDNCMIFEHAIIQPFAYIGENVIIRSGANIGHHSVIGDHSFIATQAVFGGNVCVREQVFVGVGAVVRDGLTLADRSFIGAGAVVIADTEPGSVYIGNPARKGNRTALDVSGG